MPNKNTTLLLLYLLVSLINLWAGYSHNAYANTIAFYSKPLLMPILALWFYFQTKNYPSSFRQLILFALFFSWGGDTLLMFVESKGEHFFLFGLVSFLLTHVLYTTAFFKFQASCTVSIVFSTFMSKKMLFVIEMTTERSDFIKICRYGYQKILFFEA